VTIGNTKCGCCGLPLEDCGCYRVTDAEASQSYFEKLTNTLSSGILVNSLSAIQHPPHYTFSKYEVIEVLDEWFSKEPLLWNAVKYLARWDKKGNPIEDLKKALYMVQRKIKQLEEKK
jgi:hypothetical protein